MVTLNRAVCQWFRRISSKFNHSYSAHVLLEVPFRTNRYTVRHRILVYSSSSSFIIPYSALIVQLLQKFQINILFHNENFPYKKPRIAGLSTETEPIRGIQVCRGSKLRQTHLYYCMHLSHPLSLRKKYFPEITDISPHTAED